MSENMDKTDRGPSLIRGYWRAFSEGARRLVQFQFGYRRLLGEDFQEFRQRRESRSFSYSIAGAAAIALLSLIGIIYFGQPASHEASRRLFFLRLRFLYSIDIAIALGFLATALVLDLSSKSGSTRQFIFNRVFMVWMYAIGVSFTLNAQGYNNQITNIVLALVLGAAAFSVPPAFSFTIHLAQFSLFCLLLRYFQPDPSLLVTVATNTGSATLIAFALSRAVFMADLRSFVQDKSISRKNAELRRQKTLNKVLTIAHERGLTVKELGVVKLLLTGQSNKEIASGTSVEVDTVKKHFSSIFRKCGVGSRVELLLLFGVAEGQAIPELWDEEWIPGPGIGPGGSARAESPKDPPYR